MSWPRWWEPPTSRPIWRACGRRSSRRAIPWSRFPLARGLGDGLRRAGSSFEKAGVDLESLLDRAAATATDAKAPESARLEAIALLAFGAER